VAAHRAGIVNIWRYLIWRYLDEVFGFHRGQLFDLSPRL
jgi:hypothetical protein